MELDLNHIIESFLSKTDNIAIIICVVIIAVQAWRYNTMWNTQKAILMSLLEHVQKRGSKDDS